MASVSEGDKAARRSDTGNIICCVVLSLLLFSTAKVMKNKIRQKKKSKIFLNLLRNT